MKKGLRSSYLGNSKNSEKENKKKKNGERLKKSEMNSMIFTFSAYKRRTDNLKGSLFKIQRAHRYRK